LANSTSILTRLGKFSFSNQSFCQLGEKKIAQVSQSAIIQNFLQSKLHATVPLDGDFLEEPQFSFQGSQDQIQFVAAMPASAGRLGLQLFKMNLQPSGWDEPGS
jgi:general secretion pathway protein J